MKRILSIFLFITLITYLNSFEQIFSKNNFTLYAANSTAYIKTYVTPQNEYYEVDFKSNGRKATMTDEDGNTYYFSAISSNVGKSFKNKNGVMITAVNKILYIKFPRKNTIEAEEVYSKSYTDTSNNYSDYNNSNNYNNSNSKKSVVYEAVNGSGIRYTVEYSQNGKKATVYDDSGYKTELYLIKSSEGTVYQNKNLSSLKKYGDSVFMELDEGFGIEVQEVKNSNKKNYSSSSKTVSYYSYDDENVFTVKYSNDGKTAKFNDKKRNINANLKYIGYKNGDVYKDSEGTAIRKYGSIIYVRIYNSSEIEAHETSY